MAKKNTSVNLEEDILDYIDNYREVNSLSSRNKALERIILKFQTQEREIETLKYFEKIVKGKNISLAESNVETDSEDKIEKPKEELSKKGSRFKSALSEIGDE